MKLAKKISIGSINGVRGGFKVVTERVRVMRVLGIARSCSLKVSDIGDSYKFEGEFVASGRNGDEEVASSVLYLPEPAQGALVAALDGSDGAGIELAFDFYIVPDETSLKGYIYETVPLMETRKSQALESLTTRLLGHDVGGQQAVGHGEEKLHDHDPKGGKAK